MNWAEIEEATADDEFLSQLRQALIDNNVAAIEDHLKGKAIHCPTHKNGLSSIKLEDLSLYHNVVMVRDRIWVPDSITLNIFNNLHLGHRGIDMIKWLARRSVYWTGMNKDIEGYFNECPACNRHMNKNKQLEKLPEDETSFPFECISFDGFATSAGEHGLAIVDRHTGYIWCEKTGNKETGTADKIMEILQRQLGASLLQVQRFKTDNGSNLMGCQGDSRTFKHQAGQQLCLPSCWKLAGRDIIR